MKRIKIFINLLLAMTVIGFASCNSDDPVITTSTGIPVGDGLYITIAGEDPVFSSQLKSEIVEASGFGVQEREGFQAAYIFLTAGSYQFVEVASKEIVKTYGGVATTRNTDTDDGASVNDGNSGCGFNDYTLVTITEDGASFNIASDGLYKVAFDELTSEAVLFKIEKAQIIGSATSIGWSSASGDATMETVGSGSSDGIEFAITGTTMRPGEFKVRFGCRWKIDRRIDKTLTEDTHVASNGYVIQINFGGELSGDEVINLAPGGANIAIADGEDGLYTITASWTPDDGFGITVLKTASVDPIAFVPDEHEWAVVGGATTLGWPANNDCGVTDQDIDMNYEGESGGTYSWTVTLDLAADGFKFRANDCWDENRGINDITNTGDTGDLSASNDGNYVLAVAGNYTITLSTSDEGDTYTANFLKN